MNRVQKAYFGEFTPDRLLRRIAEEVERSSPDEELLQIFLIASARIGALKSMVAAAIARDVEEDIMLGRLPPGTMFEVEFNKRLFVAKERQDAERKGSKT